MPIVRQPSSSRMTAFGPPIRLTVFTCAATGAAISVAASAAASVARSRFSSVLRFSFGSGGGGKSVVKRNHGKVLRY